MSAGLVFDVRRFSTHDGPGIRTTVFLKGCPLRCPWCHNPEGLDPRREVLFRPERCVGCGSCSRACPLGLSPNALGALLREGDREVAGGKCASCPDFGACAEACPAEALQAAGRRVEAAELVALLARDLPFYEQSGGGATFSGGEPLAQGDFLLESLRLCHDAGIRAAVDTSGFADQALVLEAASLGASFLYDIKLMDDARHREATGVSNAPILRNLRALDAAGADLRLRVPLVPGFNDRPGSAGAAGDLEAIADFAAGELGARHPLHILPYHDSARGKYRMRAEPYRLDEPHRPAGTAAPDAAALAAAAVIFASRGIAAIIGG